MTSATLFNKINGGPLWWQFHSQTLVKFDVNSPISFDRWTNKSLGGPPPAAGLYRAAMDWIVKPWAVLAARPSRREERRLGPEGLRSLPREPVAAGTADPRRRPSVAMPFHVMASRAHCGRRRMARQWPYWTERLLSPWSSLDRAFTNPAILSIGNRRQSRSPAISTAGLGR